MKTMVGRKEAAFLFGAAVLASVAGSAFAKNDNGPKLTPRGNGGIILTGPILRMKPQNDLAAMDLVTTFEGDPTAGTAKLVMVGTCKNLGSKAYQPGLRTVRIEKKVSGSWITQTAKTLPSLAAGQTFALSMEVKPNDKADYRLEVTAGGPADQNPANDLFVPSAAPVDPPK